MRLRWSVLGFTLVSSPSQGYHWVSCWGGGEPVWTPTPPPAVAPLRDGCHQGLWRDPPPAQSQNFHCATEDSSLQTHGAPQASGRCGRSVDTGSSLPVDSALFQLHEWLYNGDGQPGCLHTCTCHPSATDEAWYWLKRVLHICRTTKPSFVFNGDVAHSLFKLWHMASHLMIFVAWNSSPHLLVILAQLMRPGNLYTV